LHLEVKGQPGQYKNLETYAAVHGNSIILGCNTGINNVIFYKQASFSIYNETIRITTWLTKQIYHQSNFEKQEM